MIDFSGLSVKFPLEVDANSGFYELNQTYVEMVRQNLKNLILTNPGERIIDPHFGVGLKRYLFEPNTDNTYTSIKERIIGQVDRYMSFVRINRVMFNNADHPDVDHAYVSVRIDASILPLQRNTVLEINVSSN